MQKTVAYEGADLAYEDVGQGPVLVLIHGFEGDATVWRYQAAFLRDRYRLIIPDLPGRGQSPFPGAITPGARAWSLDACADRVHAILRHEHVHHSVVIGHSMGGYVTMALVERYPEVLSGFGLFHSTAYADSEEKIKARRRWIAFIRDNGPGPFLKQVVPNLFAETYRAEHPGEIDSLIRRGSQFDGETLIAYYEAMIARPDRRRLLKDLPVLFIIGEKDAAVSPADSLEQVRLPGISFMHYLEGVAHMGMWEATDEANRALLEFAQYIYYE